ncbi:MAG TPA: glycosyltransferase family 39 protein [Terriglobales bacterium]|nr:glycosyltransferase family 39 protein [Terriglobales bacterium]
MSRARETTGGLAALENWLRTRSDLAAAMVLLVGFALRLHAATGTFLDPDEALHFWAANRGSLSAAYEGSLHLSHPPLLVFVLYFCRWFGTSEVVLRLPSVIAGTVFCWAAFKWLTGLFGLSAGWIGLIFLAFLPPMVQLSSEVRQYALLLVFIAAAAYLLERALRENSVGLMVLGALSLYLAMLTHYSAFLFAATIGIYTMLRIGARRPATPVLVTWFAGQLFGLGIAVFLYITHLSRLEELQGAHVPNWLPSVYLPNSYFHPGHGGRWLWALARTGSIFQYTFGQLAIGDLAFPLFLVGVVLLLRKKISPGEFGVEPRLLGILLLLPFVLTCVAALLEKYPYGGSRHSAFLVMFAVAGVCVVLAKITSQRLSRASLGAILIVLACNAFAWRHQPYMLRTDQKRAHMDEALGFMQQQMAPSDVVFVNNQSSIVLGHYLCQTQAFEFDRSVPGFRSFECGGRRVIAASEEFRYTAENFFVRLNEMAQKYGLRSDQTVWIVQVGWDINFTQELKKQYPEFRDLKVQSFGQNISVFKVLTGPRGSPPAAVLPWQPSPGLPAAPAGSALGKDRGESSPPLPVADWRRRPGPHPGVTTGWKRGLSCLGRGRSGQNANLFFLFTTPA